MSNDISIQHFFGIDLAKSDSQLCVLDFGGTVLQQKRFASTVSNFEINRRRVD